MCPTRTRTHSVQIQELGSQGIVDAQIVQTTGRLHHQVVKILPMVTVHIMRNMIHFHPTDAVLDTNAHARDRSILSLLRRRQFSSPRFLLGLIRRCLLGFVALKACVFPQLTALRKAVLFFIGGCLVMLLADLCTAQTLDLLGPLVADYDVLHGMALLLATITLALSLPVLGTLDRSLYPIDDELQAWTAGQNLLQVSRFACWKLLFMPQYRIQDGGQTMDPFIGLRLTQSKQQSLHFLEGIEPEVDQDEQ